MFRNNDHWRIFGRHCTFGDCFARKRLLNRNRLRGDHLFLRLYRLLLVHRCSGFIASHVGCAVVPLLAWRAGWCRRVHSLAGRRPVVLLTARLRMPAIFNMAFAATAAASSTPSFFPS